jgi:hypothetical protein
MDLMNLRCERCEEPAVQRVMNGAPHYLCDSCHARGELVAAFNERALELSRAELDDPARAFAILEEIRSAHQGKDPEGLFDRKIMAVRAYVLNLHGRHEEALHLGQELATRPNSDVDEFVANQEMMAEALERLGNPQDARKALEAALLVSSTLRAGDALRVFGRYVRMTNVSQLPIPDAYRAAFEDVIQRLGIVVPSWLVDGPGPLGSAVDLAEEMWRAAIGRFGNLMRSLRGRTEVEKLALLDAYVADEVVGYFREKACETRENTSA